MNLTPFAYIICMILSLDLLLWILDNKKTLPSMRKLLVSPTERDFCSPFDIVLFINSINHLDMR